MDSSKNDSLSIPICLSERVMLQAPVDDQKEVNSHTGNTHTINNLTKNVD